MPLGPQSVRQTVVSEMIYCTIVRFEVVRRIIASSLSCQFAKQGGCAKVDERTVRVFRGVRNA